MSSAHTKLPFCPNTEKEKDKYLGLNQFSMFSAGFDPCKVLDHQLVIMELINIFIYDAVISFHLGDGQR